MFFNILKLFGLDVPAKIEAAKARLELRVEQATDHVKQVAQNAAVIATLFLVAIITAAMAAGVGLIAVYRWAAEAYGPYAGLAAVGTILVVATVVLVTAAAIKSRSLTADRIKSPRSSVAETTAAIHPPIHDAAASMPPARPLAASPAAIPAVPTASATELVEPLAFFLSRYVKYPSFGNPIVDELLGNLKATANGTVAEAVEHAANVIRHGDRTNLVVVLTGAAVIGWMLSNRTSQR